MSRETPNHDAIRKAHCDGLRHALALVREVELREMQTPGYMPAEALQEVRQAIQDALLVIKRSL